MMVLIFRLEGIRLAVEQAKHELECPDMNKCEKCIKYNLGK